MIHSIPATQDRYPEILSSVMDAVNLGGKVIQISSDEAQRKANGEERKHAQNDLMWVWNGLMAKSLSVSPKFAHGQAKLTILLPMCKAWGGDSLKRANFIEEVLDKVPQYQHKVMVSYDMVRTRDLSIKRMAEYLEEYQRQAAEGGVVLQSNSDLQFKDLMIYADRG